MPTPLDTELYNKVKQEADKVYSKPSAYKSGYIIKKYKELGGTYQDDNKPKNLERWFQEKWGDIGNKDYPVYRPFKRISKDTPLTVYEIDPIQAKQQIALKQKIKGNKNLPHFEKNISHNNIMPYAIRKLPKKQLYKVYNTETKVVHSNATSLENAKKQVRLLHSLERPKGGAVLNKKDPAIASPKEDPSTISIQELQNFNIQQQQIRLNKIVYKLFLKTVKYYNDNVNSKPIKTIQRGLKHIWETRIYPLSHQEESNEDVENLIADIEVFIEDLKILGGRPFTLPPRLADYAVLREQTPLETLMEEVSNAPQSTYQLRPRRQRIRGGDLTTEESIDDEIDENQAFQNFQNLVNSYNTQAYAFNDNPYSQTPQGIEIFNTIVEMLSDQFDEIFDGGQLDEINTINDQAQIITSDAFHFIANINELLVNQNGRRMLIPFFIPDQTPADYVNNVNTNPEGDYIDYLINNTRAAVIQPILNSPQTSITTRDRSLATFQTPIQASPVPSAIPQYPSPMVLSSPSSSSSSTPSVSTRSTRYSYSPQSTISSLTPQSTLLDLRNRTNLDSYLRNFLSADDTIENLLGRRPREDDSDENQSQQPNPQRARGTGFGMKMFLPHRKSGIIV